MSASLPTKHLRQNWQLQDSGVKYNQPPLFTTTKTRMLLTMPTLRNNMNLKQTISILLLLLLLPIKAYCLEPSEIIVVANKRVTESVEIATHYMNVRSIPTENLLLIDTNTTEVCSRQQYDQDIRKPVAEFLEKKMETSRIRCIVTVYGVPLKIGPGKEEAGKNRETSRAAVDSELALVLNDDYPLSWWQPNPYFIGFRNRKDLLGKDKVLMVSRLDGPDPATVYRIIKDSIITERRGLKGRACFDARWPKPEEKKKGELRGYKLYDASIHHAAYLLKKSSRIEVTLNSREELFGSGECEQPALYCGWYSLADYKDVFAWQRGAVAYHIASSELATLKEERNLWGQQMLKKGAAAVIGPVYEPFVQGFPFPDIFFKSLSEGYLTLGEAYLISIPYFSWQIILIGDPLYMPFQPE